jgi:uncharacterized membrane-anchored protein
LLGLGYSAETEGLFRFAASKQDAKTPASFRLRKLAGVDRLLVLSQALTQLLAGVLDRSLSGCQNRRALGIILLPPGAAQRFLLN